MQINRRSAVKALISGFAASSLPSFGTARAAGNCEGHQSLCLSNGFRTHYVANDSGYVVATLVLRSKEITNNGLAHLCEHTSCSGAAGTMSAAEVAGMYKDYVQDGNASTDPGAIKWDASFLPQFLPQVMGLLAATALDQKFDLKTVAAQARVVLEELYLDKYSPERIAQGNFDRELFGKAHPYAKETLEEEIERCKIAPARLAAQLRDFAATIRLPANMDLFLVGSIEPGAVERLANEHFGRFAFAEGARLQMPQVAVTQAYKGLTGASYELQRPMTDLRIAWNTGVCVTSPEARVLLALREYLNTALFDELREKDGDAYTPEVKYEPDACSGVFKIGISSSKDPQRVEKKGFRGHRQDEIGHRREGTRPLAKSHCAQALQGSQRQRGAARSLGSQDAGRNFARRLDGRNRDARRDARGRSQVHAVPPPGICAPCVGRAIGARRHKLR
jgi:predicted Zn-dependent peptidase